MKVNRIHSLVLTVKDIEATCEFYRDVLGMEVETFSPRRKALKFGNQMLNLHQKGMSFSMEAEKPTPGAIDICFIVTETMEEIQAELQSRGIKIQGLAERRGAAGKTFSIYFRDPDYNLIEVSNAK